MAATSSGRFSCRLCRACLEKLTSPRLKDGDSGGHPPGFLFHRRPPAWEDSWAGLTPAPQAGTASPAALMLTAALISRSCRVPQLTQAHSRTPSGRLATVRPQAEQVLLEGTSGRSPPGPARTIRICRPACPASDAMPRRRSRGRGGGCGPCSARSGPRSRPLAVVADEPGSELVQEVFPPVADPGVDARDPEPGLVPVRGAGGWWSGGLKG
jgi:hypothetical protein